MNKINHISLIIILALSIVFPGCVKEDLSNCPVEQDVSHYLTFEYTKNTDFVDKFAEAVTTLDVFVFDSTGILTGILSDEGSPLKAGNYKMMLDLPDGTYTFVVWGGYRSSYQVFEAIDYKTLIGSARLGDLRLALNNNCTFENTGDLFHGDTQKVSLRSGQSSHTPVSLTKNTNIINVTVNGISNLTRNAGNPIEVICSAANGEFNFDNSISDQDSLIQYIPVRIENESRLKTSFKTLRLLTGMKSGLVIRNMNSGETIFDHDLIELIRLLPNISTDDDLDRNDVYDIEINLHTNLSVSVIINGYRVINSDQEIQ